MSSLISQAVLFFGAVLALQLVCSLYRRASYAKRARRLGCEPVPILPQPWPDPTGIKLISYFNLHAEDSTLIDASHSLFKMTSQHEQHKVMTLECHALGTNFFTYDPKNIQAILATQCEDFEIGSQRIGQFLCPFLGLALCVCHPPVVRHLPTTVL